jgi:hypothetical protein
VKVHADHIHLEAPGALAANLFFASVGSRPGNHPMLHYAEKNQVASNEKDDCMGEAVDEIGESDKICVMAGEAMRLVSCYHLFHQNN